MRFFVGLRSMNCSYDYKSASLAVVILKPKKKNQFFFLFCRFYFLIILQKNVRKITFDTNATFVVFFFFFFINFFKNQNDRLLFIVAKSHSMCLMDVIYINTSLYSKILSSPKVLEKKIG